MTLALDRPAHIWGYGRASTNKQKITLEAQEERVGHYAKYKFPEMSIRIFFADEAITGGMPWQERPQGKLLFNVARPGDHIVIAKLDRAFRSVADAAAITKSLLDNNITLHIVDMNLDLSDHYGRFFFHIVAAFAELEKELISARTKEALDWKRRRGLPLGRSPYGWKKVGMKRDSRYVPDPKHRSICYLIVEMRDAHMIPWRDIPTIIRKRGYKAESRTFGTKKKMNPAGEVSPFLCQKMYEAAKDGFPLRNGARKHCFDWEPALWLSWGVNYNPDQPLQILDDH